MAYGSATSVQELTWGAAKSTVPASVTAALAVATEIINSTLNIQKELTGTDKPAQFDSIANLFASGILQEARKPEEKAQNTFKAEKLLDLIKDEMTDVSRGEAYHIRFVEPK